MIHHLDYCGLPVLHICLSHKLNNSQQEFRLSLALISHNSFNQIGRGLLLVAFCIRYLHKNKPYCRSIPTAPRSEEWSVVYSPEDFVELNLILVPLEYESSIRLKHSHTFTESLSQIIRPALLGKLTILTPKPRFFPCMN
nr:MAG TPA: hypothetical protein [Bacteriophage sp.]